MMLHGCIIVPLFLCSTKLGMEPNCSSNGCLINMTFKQLLIIYERAGSCVTCTQPTFKEMHPHNTGVMGSGRCPETRMRAFTDIPTLSLVDSNQRLFCLFRSKEDVREPCCDGLLHYRNRVKVERREVFSYLMFS